PQILRIPVGFLNTVRGVLSVGRVHPLGGDQQFRAGDPVGDDDIDLLEIIFPKDVCRRYCDAADVCGGRDAMRELGLELPRKGFGEGGNGGWKDPRVSGSWPDLIGIEASSAELVAEPNIECE